MFSYRNAKHALPAQTGLHLGRRTAITQLAALALAPVADAFAANAKELVEIPLLMTPINSGVYNAYAVMQSRVEAFEARIRPIVYETGGFNYNVALMAKSRDKWANTMFGSATVLEWAARTGVKPFYEAPLEAVRDFRIIGGMGPTSNFWLTFNPNIKTPRDFAGKAVATGLLTQNEWGMYQRMLLDGWGITRKLKSFSPLNPGANVEAMLDGRVDVCTMVSFFAPGVAEISLPAPFKTLQSSKRPYYYVNIPPEMLEGYNKRTGSIFQIRNWPRNSYPNQPEPFSTFGDDMSVSVHKSFPSDLAYEFAKLWVRMAPTVAKYNSLGRIWTPDVIAGPAKRVPEQVHPGALKAFKELNLA